MVWTCSCDATFAREGYYLEHLEMSIEEECAPAKKEYIDKFHQRPFRHNPPRRLQRNRNRSTTSPPRNLSGDRTTQSNGGNAGGSSSAATGDHTGRSASVADEEGEPPPEPFRGDFFSDDYREEDFPYDDPGPPADPPDVQVLAEDHLNVQALPDEEQPDVPGLSHQAPPVHEGSDNEDDDEELEAVGRDTLDVDDAPESDAPLLPPATGTHLTEQDGAPPPSVVQQSAPSQPEDASSGATSPRPSAPGGIKATVHDQLRTEPAHISHFGGLAGSPIDPHSARTSGYHAYGKMLAGGEENPYAPFRSEMDWKIAQWAKTRSPTSNVFSELLAIKGLVDALGLSYKSSSELNSIINENLPHRRPQFSRYAAKVMGEKFEMYARPILECIIALYRDPEHAQYLCFAPERHYADSDKTIRLYHDLHTGQWWWTVQEALEAETPGATVIPIIISSDKTQVTLFRNKTAYPVYLTIGNLPKSVRQKPGRQGQILLAYLPTSRLDHITNQAARRRVVQNMFHACMTQLLEPLQVAGVEGIVLTSGDGVSRRCHPILAAYVGDYPEQCLVYSFSTENAFCMMGHQHENAF